MSQRLDFIKPFKPFSVKLECRIVESLLDLRADRCTVFGVGILKVLRFEESAGFRNGLLPPYDAGLMARRDIILDFAL